MMNRTVYISIDASIICGELEMDADVANAVLNPKVVVEVLSKQVRSMIVARNRLTIVAFLRYTS